MNILFSVLNHVDMAYRHLSKGTGSLLITASAFFSHFLTNGWGIAMTGVYYVTFLEVFKKSHSITACIGSLNYAVTCVMGNLLSSKSAGFITFINKRPLV